jgi:hypothetical protein
MKKLISIAAAFLMVCRFSTLTLADGDGASLTNPAVSAGPGLTQFFCFGGGASNFAVAASNTLSINGFMVGAPESFSKIGVFVQAADASAAKYDFCIYNTAGTLVANVGPASYPTGGGKILSIAQGTASLAPGVYLFAMTGNATTLAITGCNGSIGYFWNGAQTSYGTSAAGACPTSITPPSTGLTGGAGGPSFALAP